MTIRNMCGYNEYLEFRHLLISMQICLLKSGRYVFCTYERSKFVCNEGKVVKCKWISLQKDSKKTGKVPVNKKDNLGTTQKTKIYNKN